MKKGTRNIEETLDLTDARKFLMDIVPQAGEILKRHFNVGGYSTKQKAGVDFTTQADEEVDTFLRKHIAERFPQTHFLTEETAPENYSSLKYEENLWVIDPLDGTVNFSRKHPNFAISIALVNKGVSQLVVVYIPMTGDIYWGQADITQAFINGEPMHTSMTNNLREAVLACDWAWGLEKRLNVVKWLGRISTHIRQVKSMGSAVADLASLANGRVDVYVHSGLKPWDVAASALLIEKAGGKITTPTGEKWDVFDSDILASNGILHERILNLINS